MNTTEILTIVQQVTGFSLTELRHRHRFAPVIEARYVFLILMVEEGYNLYHIADVLMIPWNTLRHSERRADALLRFDKSFKAIYLQCITVITEREDLECV